MRREISPSELDCLLNLIGAGIWQLQNVEDALDQFITIKHEIKEPGSVSLEEANAILKKHRKKTLGNSINFSKENNVCSVDLQNRLEKFNKERIWLVHKVNIEHGEDLYEDDKRFALMGRIKVFIKEAESLHKLVLQDLEGFAIGKGISRQEVYKDAEDTIAKLKGEK